MTKRLSPGIIFAPFIIHIKIGTFMKAHWLQHVPFEGLGSIESWLVSKGYSITHTPFFNSTELPDIKDIDLLIIMGGPMSVHDIDQYPWIALEKAFIRSAIDAGKKVLGVCLGAQLIAHAMGARVYKNSVKEIGWLPIHAASQINGSCFRFPSTANVFHWHGETFDLPQGAALLASSDGCKNQAFQIGKHVVGLQFHMETTYGTAQDIITHCRHELVPSEYVQTEDDILSINPDVFEEINQMMRNVLSFLTSNCS